MNSGFSSLPCRHALLPVWVCLIALTSSWAGFEHSLSGDEQIASGTSSQKARMQAVDAVPMQNLTLETQQKIGPILDRPSIYRRLPVTAINVDPEYFVFLVRYPEVIVNIWKIMGITQMATVRTAPFEIATDDGSGTISNVELIYGTPNLHIFYGEGRYEGPVLKRQLHGRCVLLMRTEYRQDANGNPVATSSLDVFLKVENATVNLIARTLNPIVGRTADHNFVESLKFVQRLNETTLENGPGVQRMANRLGDLTEEVRGSFQQIAGMVYNRNLPAPGGVAAQPAVSAAPPGTGSYSSSGRLPTSPVRLPYDATPALPPAGTNVPQPPAASSGNRNSLMLLPARESRMQPPHSSPGSTVQPGVSRNVGWSSQPASYSVPPTTNGGWSWHRQTGYQAPLYPGYRIHDR